MFLNFNNGFANILISHMIILELFHYSNLNFYWILNYLNLLFKAALYVLFPMGVYKCGLVFC